MQLKITGSNIEQTKTINNFDYKKHHFSLESIKNETNAFKSKLEKFGYLNNSIKSVTTQNDTLYIGHIDLKKKTNAITIYIDSSLNNKDYYSKLDLPEVKNNQFTLPFLSIEKKLTEYNSVISASGYPFSNLSLTDIKQQNETTLSARLVIETKQDARKLDNIIIKGYKKFPKAFLKRYLKIRPNKTFDIKGINKKVLSLNELSFASQIKDPEILFTKDSTQLYLYLKKTISNSFDGFIGFTTEETTNKLKFNGYLNLVLVNNLNYGESLHLNYKSDESDQKDFNLKTNIPYLFGSPLGIEASLKILKRDSTFISTKQKTSLFYQLNSKSNFYIGTANTESNNLSTTNAPTNVKDFTSRLYTLRYQYTKRQNQEKLFQIKSYLNAEFGLGNRKTTNTNNKQSLINIEAEHILNLNKKNSLYLKGTAHLLNSDNYLENELIRFGGINNIRGFTENSLSANNLLVLNTEYRYKLSSNLFVNTVFDIANFQNKVLNQKENLYGFGFGFGILTKGGLLRFIYANGKTEDAPFKLNNSKIHLKLNTTF